MFSDAVRLDEPHGSQEHVRSYFILFCLKKIKPILGLFDIIFMTIDTFYPQITEMQKKKNIQSCYSMQKKKKNSHYRNANIMY